ncbi:MAG: ThiF family adenylyltransferase [Planctomycetota bacterium]|jgi:adenylyltransferase/sulfurtransferase
MGDLERYHRQILLPAIGEAGQRRLLDAHALVVGCGALGTMITDALARAGAGALSVVDRDTVELTNLQRQVLFDESDVERTVPKARAAADKIARINSCVTVHAHVDDFNHRNAERYIEGVDVILDGLDNFETRYLLNDLAVKYGLPYVYGGAVATGGMSMAILPHSAHRTPRQVSSVTWDDRQATPCLRCVFPDAPPPGVAATCDTAGVLGPAVAIIAAHQVAQAIKLLTGNLDALDRSLLSIDVWRNRTQRLDVGGAREAGTCPCCGAGRFEFLAGEAASATTSLCGRNAVQITPADAVAAQRGLDLAQIASRLAAHGDFRHNGYLVHGRFATETDGRGDPLELTLFPDGRAIIKGTTEPEAARSIYARYVGG